MPENIISNMRRKDCLDLVCVLAGIFFPNSRTSVNKLMIDHCHISFSRDVPSKVFINIRARTLMKINDSNRSNRLAKILVPSLALRYFHRMYQYIKKRS